jgi:hypothetical protein
MSVTVVHDPAPRSVPSVRRVVSIGTSIGALSLQGTGTTKGIRQAPLVVVDRARVHPVAIHLDGNAEQAASDVAELHREVFLALERTV